jgi:TPR repeat protein
MNSPESLAALARAGRIEELLALWGGVADPDDVDTEAEAAATAYKWLCVASDFGHSEANGWIDTLLEASPLRFDDDNFLTGAAHFELGVAYLTGCDGLALDTEKGREHLQAAAQRHYPASVMEGSAMIDGARASLTAVQREVFDSVFVS